MNNKKLNAFNWFVVMCSIFFSCMNWSPSFQNFDLLQKMNFVTFFAITFLCSLVAMLLNLMGFFTSEEKPVEQKETTKA